MRKEMKVLLQIIKWVAYLLAGVLLLGSLSLLMYRVYLEKSTRIETPNGISSLEEITLGGLKQWIFIRGTDQDNPVLLFLHGGPGAPLMGMSSSRILDAGLIEHFTVVHWDQRGAGKSYNSDIPINSMTFDRLVEDCNELVDYLRNRFNTEKVFIVGHSAGSIIGIKTAHKYPEKIHAYVGVGQIINDYERQIISYSFVVDEAEKSGNVKMQNTLEAISPPPFDSLEKLYRKDEYVSRFGGVLHDKGARQMWLVGMSFITSPEYSLLEGLNTITMKGYRFTMNAMWEENRSVNLTKEIRSIKVPIYFFEGKYDMATPIAPVEEFYNGLDAEKGKKFIIFENSAHLPMVEEKEKYQDLLVNVVLKESQDE
jgi:pimeloyl-ACP methyl ester carboxylesterase